MDLKSVQQQLKASISKHQMLMTQMKTNPEDISIRTSLQEIQKRIAELGTLQKNLGKSKKSDSGVQNQLLNGNDKKQSASATTAAGFLKLEPNKSVFGGNNSFLISTLSPSSLCLTSSTHKTTVKSSANFQCHDRNTNVLCQNFSKLDSQSAAQQPLNLTSKVKASVPGQNELLSRSIAEKNPSQALELANVCNTDAKNKSVQPNLFMQSPMQIRFQVPITSSNCVPIQVFPPSHLFNPTASSSVFRLPSHQSTSMNVPYNKQNQILLSVARTTPSSSLNLSKRVTTTKRSVGDQTEVVGTFKKFRIVGAKITGLASLSNSSSPCTNTPEAMQSSICAETPESSSLLNQKLVDPSICNSISKTGNSPPITNVRSYAVTTDPNSEKISFLGQVDLVPRERAEKLRSRRYGRRRAVAHPLYSGGMYVSTTATDSVKRILSNEIFNLGIDVLPTKRPRGRPKGSTSKRSFSPIELSNGANKEYIRILQEAKPPAIPTLQQNKAEDLCEVCRKPGEFLMCDTCSQLYHMQCLNPPLQSVPTGMWYCSKCKNKIDHPVDAITWPGFLPVIQSFVAFNCQREIALTRSREKAKMLKSRHNKLNEQKKLLSGILKEKVCQKSRQTSLQQDSLKACENLTMLLEKIRCAINQTLDAA